MRSLPLSWASSRPHLCLVAGFTRGGGQWQGQLLAVELPAATPHRQWAVLVICSQVPPFVFVQRNKDTGTDKSQEHWDEHKEKNIKILPRSITQIVPQLFSLASSTYKNKCVSTGVLCLKKKLLLYLWFYILLFFFFKIDLFIFGCAGSSLLVRLFPSCSEWGYSSLQWLLLFGTRGPGPTGFSSCGSWALGYRLRSGTRA